MDGAIAAMGTCFLFVGILLLIIFVIQWKLFTKAGRPGWESLVPIYNTWILVTEVCKKEPLWFILSLIPFVNIVAAWVICQELAKKFGKTEGFGIGLFFLTPIFMAILAFGDAEYIGNRKKRREYAGDFDDEDDDDDDDDRPRKKKKRNDDNW